MSHRSRNWIAASPWLLLGLLGLSLLLPVATIENTPTDEVYYGYMMLLAGPLGILIGKLAWFANVILLIAAVRLASGKPMPWVVPLLLVACAIDAMLWTRIAYDDGWHEVSSYQVGYYVWLAAVLLGAVLGAASAKGMLSAPRS